MWGIENCLGKASAMAQWLRALSVLVEVSDLIPSPHMVVKKHPLNSSRDPTEIYMVHIYTHAGKTIVYIK